jgi:hypothetical protein
LRLIINHPTTKSALSEVPDDVLARLHPTSRVHRDGLHPLGDQYGCWDMTIDELCVNAGMTDEQAARYVTDVWAHLDEDEQLIVYAWVLDTFGYALEPSLDSPALRVSSEKREDEPNALPLLVFSLDNGREAERIAITIQNFADMLPLGEAQAAQYVGEIWFYLDREQQTWMCDRVLAEVGRGLDAASSRPALVVRCSKYDDYPYSLPVLTFSLVPLRDLQNKD